MIKAVLKNGDGSPTILLGLTKENVTRLMAGEPVAVDMALLGQAPGTIVIMYGDDTNAITSVLRMGGLDVPDLPEPESGQEVYTMGHEAIMRPAQKRS